MSIGGAILQGWESKFFMPAANIFIAVGGVFKVVTVTMLYSMRKIKKENAVDALRNENL